MTLAEIGILIRQRREFLHLRQEDLAELSTTAIKTIHLMEQGSGNPSFETLQRTATVLGLAIELKVKIN